MPARSPMTSSAANPFVLWGTLALKTMQMSTAAAQVIAIRTTRMAAHGLAPNEADRKEMTRMGAEKVDAFSQAGAAVAMGLTPAMMSLAGQTLRGSLDIFNAGARLAASRSVTQAFERQRVLADTLIRHAPTGRKGSAAAAKLAHSALAPVHRKATGNAKRLAKPR